MPQTLSPALPDLDARIASALPPEGGCVLFTGAPARRAVDAAQALAEARGLRLVSVTLEPPDPPRYSSIVALLREPFDEARGGAALVLDRVGALLTVPLNDEDEHHDEDDDPHARLAKYLKDRVEAFEGAVFLVTERPVPGLDEIADVTVAA